MEEERVWNVGMTAALENAAARNHAAVLAKQRLQQKAFLAGLDPREMDLEKIMTQRLAAMEQQMRSQQ